jgi:hypothetical protein
MATIDSYEDAVCRIHLSSMTFTMDEAAKIEKHLQSYPTPINGYRHKWVGVKTGTQWHFINP